MFRASISILILLLATACGTHSELRQSEPIYDEIAEVSRYDLDSCIGIEFGRVAYTLGRPARFRNRGFLPAAESETAAVSIYNLSEWEVIITPEGPDRSHVVIRAHNFLGDYTLSTFGLIEAVRSCTDVYGTGYDRPIRAVKPGLVSDVPIKRDSLVSCIRSGFVGKVKGTALLHASESEVWINSYFSRPPRNIWEARFESIGDNGTHIEVRFSTDEEAEGSLNNILREQLKACSAKLT